MKEVASLRYGVIFKKAFSVPAIFTAFVRDVIGVHIEIDHVETEKSFDPPIGRIAVEFDLYAEDKKNRIVVDIQHERYSDHYHRFLHYQCAALLEQVANAGDYQPKLSVYTVVVLTSGDKHQRDLAIIDFDPHDLAGKPLGKIPHKVFYLCPKYANADTPPALREWLRAIDDSLDEQVDEAQYTHPEIKQIFTVIEKDLVTPQERAQMFEESHQEELKQTSYEEGRTEQALTSARAMLADGLPPAAVAKYTSLTVAEVQALLAGDANFPLIDSRKQI
jgi:predicted transposase/invertase (TIGR01784 family)